MTQSEAQARRLWQAAHQVEVLHRSAAGTFAEIVEPCDQAEMPGGSVVVE